MNLTNLILWSAGIITAWIGAHNIDSIQRTFLKAQARLIYESRTETWGSPKFLHAEFKPKVSSTKPHKKETDFQIANPPSDFDDPRARLVNSHLRIRLRQGFTLSWPAPLRSVGGTSIALSSLVAPSAPHLLRRGASIKGHQAKRRNL